MPVVPSSTRLASVDDRLGPAPTRFFGAGFRRVTYSVRDIATSVGDDLDFTLTARVGVSYPRDWSRKGTSDLRPHFSTVDAIVLGSDSAVLGIADAHGLDPAAAAQAHVRSMRISASGQPDEYLADLPLTLSATGSQADERGGVVTRTDCRVGAMRVRCEVEHPTGTPQPGARRHHDPATVLGPSEQRYFAGGFRSWQQHLRDVVLDPDGRRADARLDIEPDRSGPPPAPTTTAPPGVTTVDAFVTALQLGQVLLYELDGVGRAESETLWMRQTTLAAGRPDPNDAQGCAAGTWLERCEVVEMAGARWRTADIVAAAGGVTIRCAVTHRLPGR